MPARLLPLARLLEVVVHHVDLDIGFEFADIENTTAEWLLEWSAFRVRSREEFPRLDLTSDSGFASASAAPATDRGAAAATPAARLGDEPVDDSAVSGARGCTGRRSEAIERRDDRHDWAQPCRTGRPASGGWLSPAVTMSKVRVGGMDNNAYLLQSAGRCWSMRRTTGRAAALIGGGAVDTIVTTHRHGDHWQALAAVAERTGARLVGGRPDRRRDRREAGVEDLVGVWDGDTVALGDETLEVIGLVGHTPGSITLAYTGGGGGRTCSPGTACSRRAGQDNCRRGLRLADGRPGAQGLRPLRRRHRRPSGARGRHHPGRGAAVLARMAAARLVAPTRLLSGDPSRYIVDVSDLLKEGGHDDRYVRDGRTLAAVCAAMWLRPSGPDRLRDGFTFDDGPSGLAV